MQTTSRTSTRGRQVGPSTTRRAQWKKLGVNITVVVTFVVTVTVTPPPSPLSHVSQSTGGRRSPRGLCCHVVEDSLFFSPFVCAMCIDCTRTREFCLTLVFFCSASFRFVEVEIIFLSVADRPVSFSLDCPSSFVFLLFSVYPTQNPPLSNGSWESAASLQFRVSCCSRSDLGYVMRPEGPWQQR